MLAVARERVPRDVSLTLGRAEELPFGDGRFERAVARLVVHLLDRARAFAELQRVLVPGGRLVVATFDESHFGSYWLNRFFPSLEAVDRARFPTRAQLDGELRAAGFGDLRFERLCHRREIDRETALVRIRGRFLSTFDLLPPEEVVAGTERSAAELPGRVEVVLDHLVVVADRPAQ